MRATYKYICVDCEGVTWFSAKERISRFGMRCQHCGSSFLDPSENSLANHNIGAFHDVKRFCHEEMDEKSNGFHNA